MVQSALVVTLCLGAVFSDTPHPAQYQYHPYHQHQHRQYRHLTNNRRHFQPAPSHSRGQLERLETSSHLSSPAFRYKPRTVRTNRQYRPGQYGYDRHPILIQPTQQNKVFRRPLQVPVSSERLRSTRKIEQTPLLLASNHLPSSKHSGQDGTKHRTKFPIKNDNLALESQVVESKVKVGGEQLFTSAHKQKPQPVKSSQNSVKPAVAKVPLNRNYNTVPQGPKFIIQQAGPSQQFGWAGHGHYAPLNIPNIFKAAGINTRWIPGQDPVFQVGLLYPSPPSQYSPPPPPPAAPAAPAYSGAVKVKKSIPKTQYSEYKQSGRVEQPAVPPPYSGPPPSPSTPAPTTTSTTTTPRPTTTTRRTLRYSPAASYSQSTRPPSYQYSADYVQPSTYKPSFVSSTSRPFSVFIGSSSPAPVTRRPKPKDNKDEEVFYIFYENDDKPLEPVKTGVDLQKYIEEEIENFKEDSDFSSQDPRKRKTSRPVSSAQSLIDVPIKTDESGEGFTPPSKIRKVFVPRQKSESQSVFDVSVGTSFGYNKPSTPFFSFPSSEGSSYSNPVTSYRAPAVTPDKTKLNKPVKKVKRVKKERLTDEDQLSSLPFGTRLERRDSFDIIKK